MVDDVLWGDKAERIPDPTNEAHRRLTQPITGGVLFDNDAEQEAYNRQIAEENAAAAAAPHNPHDTEDDETEGREVTPDPTNPAHVRLSAPITGARNFATMEEFEAFMEKDRAEKAAAAAVPTNPHDTED